MINDRVLVSDAELVIVLINIQFIIELHKQTDIRVVEL